jgi:hypothetical protein
MHGVLVACVAPMQNLNVLAAAFAGAVHSGVSCMEYIIESLCREVALVSLFLLLLQALLCTILQAQQGPDLAQIVLLSLGGVGENPLAKLLGAIVGENRPH